MCCRCNFINRTLSLRSISLLLSLTFSQQTINEHFQRVLRWQELCDSTKKFPRNAKRRIDLKLLRQLTRHRTNRLNYTDIHYYTDHRRSVWFYLGLLLRMMTLLLKPSSALGPHFASRAAAFLFHISMLFNVWPSYVVVGRWPQVRQYPLDIFERRCCFCVFRLTHSDS